MKVKHLSLATAGSLLLAGAASAAFTGIEIYNMNDFFANHPNVNVRNSWNGEGGAYDVYRVYAEFDAPGTVTATFGAGGVGQLMYMTNVTSGTFINYADTTYHGGTTHYDTAPSGVQIGNSPAIAYDTFATIGLFVNDSNTTLTNGVSAGTNNFQGDWDSDSFTGGTGGWFSFDPLAAQTQSTTSSQGLADAVNRVMLFQLVVPAGDKVEGQFGIQVGGEGNIYDSRTFFSTNGVPAPGALALLGLAGLAGARRRRK